MISPTVIFLMEFAKSWRSQLCLIPDAYEGLAGLVTPPSTDWKSISNKWQLWDIKKKLVDNLVDNFTPP